MQTRRYDIHVGVYTVPTCLCLSLSLTHFDSVRDFIVCWTWHKWRWLFYCIHKRTVYNLLWRPIIASVFDLNVSPNTWFKSSKRLQCEAGDQCNMLIIVDHLMYSLLSHAIACLQLISIKRPRRKICKQEENFRRKMLSASRECNTRVTLEGSKIHCFLPLNSFLLTFSSQNFNFSTTLHGCMQLMPQSFLLPLQCDAVNFNQTRWKRLN